MSNWRGMHFAGLAGFCFVSGISLLTVQGWALLCLAALSDRKD